MSSEAIRRLRGLLISNTAEFVAKSVARFEQTMLLYTVAWDAEIITAACKEWRPDVVLMDTSAINGHIAALLIKGQCDQDVTLIGFDAPQVAHLYQVGHGARLLLSTPVESVVEHLEKRSPDEIPF